MGYAKGTFNHSEESKRRISEKMKDKKNSLGYKHTEEWKKRTGELVKARKIPFRSNQKGSQHWNWQGGKSPISDRYRDMKEYLDWRSFCFQRDSWTCQTCQSRKPIIVHHIIPFSELLKTYKINSLDMARFCKQLWDTNNGVTLCTDCHKSAHQQMRRMK